MLPITVLMPVFNGEKYLKGSIQSILDQTFTNFEFIIVDDCSTDSTPQILETFADNRIQIIRNTKNLGISSSLNIGIKASSGRYIARSDADDISLPERLEKQYNFMNENPQIGILGTGYYVIDEFDVEEDTTYIYPQDPVEIRWKLLAGPVLPHPTVMLRKNVLIANNLLYNEEYSVTQDYELWCRIIQFTEGTNFPQALVKYRHHHNAKSKAQSNLQEKLRLKVSAELLMKNYQIPDFTMKQAYIFGVIINSGIRSLELTELKKVYKIFFHILDKFKKKMIDSKSSIRNWQHNRILPLIVELERLIINTAHSRNKDYIFYLQFLFKLSFRNRYLCFGRLFSDFKLFIYYPVWLIQLIIYWMISNIKLSKSLP